MRMSCAAPLVALVVLFASGIAQAQVGPARAHPIAGATKKLPMMLIDQKHHKVVLDVNVDAEGRVTSTTIVEHSNNGIFDERMRGYWKDTLFMPALDGEGRPTTDTLRITNAYSVEDRGSASLKGLRNHSEIEGGKPGAVADRIQRMRCADLLWEVDFMKHRAPRAKLEHEEIFHVPFAMFLAEGRVNETARDALIAEWASLVDRTIATCRDKPDAKYWKDVFAPVFTRAMPYQSLPVP